MRGVLFLFVLATSVSTVVAKPKHHGDASGADHKPAPAAAPDPMAPAATPGPDDGKATALLDQLAAATDDTARKTAITQLDELAPRAVDAIGAWLARAHKTDVADRRGVLASIKASVPDKTGKFITPARQTGKEQKADDDLDWLAELFALPAGGSDQGTNDAARGEVIADVAAIRALAQSKDARAAQRVFDAAFGDDTTIYRDECGRYLRKMEPTSIPALTAQSQGKDADRKRYATWQLERLDRQEPEKALDAALGDEALTIAILQVFRKTHHREAVHAVWHRVDADSPRVREAARAAWMDYITGPPPPPAPTAKLNLPGGKKTKKAKPLWLTYRELADNELRKSANELLHEDYPIVDPSIDDNEHEQKQASIDLEEVTARLFKYFDDARAKQDAAQWAAAKQKADAGDLATAVQLTDRMLATNPDRPERAEMAKVYFAWGKQLEAKQAWADAAAAYSKAHGLDPAGAQANDALAAHHFTLGKQLAAEGKDGGPDFRKAVALKPDYAPARSAAVEAAHAGRPSWMLYAAGGAGALALLLFAAALMRRRA
jgi:tetratricopeptide (TPR) repeat protein